MPTLTEIATRNFMQAVNQVKDNKPVIGRVKVDSYSKIATLIKAQRSVFTGMSTGERAVTLEHLIKFCKVFGYDLNDIAGLRPKATVLNKEIDFIIGKLQELKK